MHPVVFSLLSVAFYGTELILSTPFGLLSDRLGHHRVMQFGPIFGGVAVVLTWATTDLCLLGGTRLLEGASTAASVPSILGFIAAVTAGDELLRGRAAARFEGATLAGLGVGLVAAGPLFIGIGGWGGLGRNGLPAQRPRLCPVVLHLPLRGGSGRRGRRPSGRHGGRSRRRPGTAGWRAYPALLRESSVLVLAPTWIALNAALGLWTTQSIFNLVRKPDPRFADQLLMGRFEPNEISVGLGIGLVLFFIGLAFWGDRFKRYPAHDDHLLRRPAAGAAIVLARRWCSTTATAGTTSCACRPSPSCLGGLFVLAGATPAALGLLADTSETHPADRGAIMGLYSVFLALGQIIGSLLGGTAAEIRGIDGILVATLILLAIALAPLSRLRAVEHRLEPLLVEAPD